MKLSEAKMIVAKMVSWSMMSNGIELDKKPDAITESLEDLLKASQLVERSNKKNLQKTKSGSTSVQMNVASRGIAALYVAANFQGTSADDVSVLALHGNNVVLCLNKNELKDNE